MNECGDNVNIERGAVFSPEVKIGNNSGIGIKSEIYGYTTIGKDVMKGPEVIIYTQNHSMMVITLFINKDMMIINL